MSGDHIVHESHIKVYNVTSMQYMHKSKIVLCKGHLNIFDEQLKKLVKGGNRTDGKSW